MSSPTHRTEKHEHVSENLENHLYKLEIKEGS